MSARQAALLALLALPAATWARAARVAVLDASPAGADGQPSGSVADAVLDEVSRFQGADAVRSSGGGKSGSAPGCADDADCLREVGRQLGADRLLLASQVPFGSGHRVVLRLVDARSARTEAEFTETVEDGGEAPRQAARRLVRRLLGPLVPRAPRIAEASPAAGPPAPMLVPPLLLERQSEPAATATRTAPAPGGGHAPALIVGGAGLGLIAAGAVLGIMAQDAYQAEKRASAAGDQAAYEANRAAATRRARAADLLYASGAAGIVVGISLELLFGHGGGPTSVSVSAEPGRVAATVAGRF